MDTDSALDDLKTIRSIMERTRRRSGKAGGRLMILWGIIWFIGFLGNQFLPQETVAWLWPGLSTLGIGISIWSGVRTGRRKGMHTPIKWAFLLYWLALFVFDGLLVWLFHLGSGRDLALLFTLSVALAYFQLGLFTHWAFSAIGGFIAALIVGAATLLPDYLDLTMALLGGGVLAGSGIWFVHNEE